MQDKTGHNRKDTIEMEIEIIPEENYEDEEENSPKDFNKRQNF